MLDGGGHLFTTLLLCFVMNKHAVLADRPGREDGAMGRDGLGELEHQVMLALLRLGEEAYTAPVVRELAERAGRETTTASAYVVLRRLEEKGLVASHLGDPGPEGGRDRRYFEVTAEGLERLRAARDAYTALWDGLGVLDPQG
jgi:DNA-binding PadR family transcriptional regulator